MHFKKVSHAFILRALGNGFAVLNTFLLVRLLATDEYGSFRLLNSLVIIVFEFSNLGLLQTLTRVAIDEFDKKNQGFLSTYLPRIKIIWLIQFFLTVIFVLFYMYFRAPAGITGNMYLFLGYIIVCGICYFWSHYWIHLLYATRRILHWFSFLALLNGLKFIGLVILVGFMSRGFEGALLSHLIAFTLGSVYSYLFWKRSLKKLVSAARKEQPVHFNVRFHLFYGVAHFINVEINHFTGEFIILFLNFLHYTPDVVGFTGLAVSMLYMFINFVVVLANYFFPNLPAMLAEDNISKLRQTLRLQVEGSALVTWGMIIGFYLTAPLFFQNILPDYQQAAYLFTAFFLVLSMKPYEYEFVNLTLTRKMNWLLVVKSVSQFALLIMALIGLHLMGVLSPWYALLFVGITDLISLALVFSLAKKRLMYNFWRVEYIFHILAAVIFMLSFNQDLVMRTMIGVLIITLQLFLNRRFITSIISRYSEG